MMEWMLIALLWWKEPAPSFVRFATEAECRAAGDAIMAMAKRSQNKGAYECQQVQRRSPTP